MSNEENRNSPKTIAKTVLITIFLGALGSGLWELFLSDVVSWVWRQVAEGLSSVSSTFLDNLHSRIGKGYIETFGSWTIVVFTTFGTTLGMWAASIIFMRSIKEIIGVLSIGV